MSADRRSGISSYPCCRPLQESHRIHCTWKLFDPHWLPTTLYPVQVLTERSDQPSGASGISSTCLSLDTFSASPAASSPTCLRLLVCLLQLRCLCRKGAFSSSVISPTTLPPLMHPYLVPHLYLLSKNRLNSPPFQGRMRSLDASAVRVTLALTSSCDPCRHFLSARSTSSAGTDTVHQQQRHWQEYQWQTFFWI